jgi:hypothetical protein
MVLPTIFRSRRAASGRSWSARWAAFLMDRPGTATAPMSFDWLSN